MATLITMGCSFIQGVGIWYEDIEPINLENREYHQKKYLEYHHKVQLQNCIGSHLQKELGYETFCNFGVSGTSLSNQLRLWYQEPPIISDNDVLFLLFVTYPIRIGNYLNGKIGDVVNLENSFLANYPYFHNEEEGRDEMNLKLDLDLETIFNIKIIKDYCESRGWKFEYGLIDCFYEDLYTAELGPPFPNPFRNYILDLKTEQCKISPHPNKLGYLKLSNNLIEWIRENKKDWYRKEVPKYRYSSWKSYNYTINGDKIELEKNRF